MIFVVAVVGMLAGAFCVAFDMQTQDVMALDRELGAGRVVSLETAQKLVGTSRDWDAMKSCRRDVVVALGYIYISGLATLIDNGEVAKVAPALNELSRIARAVLHCSPGDGVAWAWLAYATEQTGGSPELVRQLYQRSQWLAPSELGVLFLRLPEMTRAKSRRGAMFDDMIRADVRTLFKAKTLVADDAALIMGPVFPWLEPIAREEFRAVDDTQQRAALVQSFGDWNANIAGCSRDRFNDWRFRWQHGSCEDEDRLPNFDWKKPVPMPAK